MNNGIWLEFDNARWYDSVPTAFASSEPLGGPRLPVYRDKTRTDGAIWVSVFKRQSCRRSVCETVGESRSVSARPKPSLNHAL
jgi:hypothetical protein